LRIKALEDRIDDRVIVECLYKWTLASRVSLFQRVHDRQLKESTFLTWVTKTNQRSNTLDAAERRFAQFKRTQLLRTCLRRMEAVTTERRAEEFAVIAECQQKLKQRIFEKLKERHGHFQQLNNWAGDAHFYVLSKSTLRTWSQATQHARRNRRRDAYAQVRRMVKTNLARRLFANWRGRANHIALVNQQASNMLEDRTLQKGASLLHHWHDRTMTLRQQDSQATDLHAYKLGTRFFHTWSERMITLNNMDVQAVALRQESAELAATSALKKLGWRLWNIQRQEENARALYGRNFEKHIKAIIRFWMEQTNDRLANRPVSPTPTNRSTRSRRGDDEGDGDGYDGNDNSRFERDDGQGDLVNAGDETRHLETWTAFDENALGLDNDLDLSLSITPVHQPSSKHPPPSSTRPQPHRSILRPTPARPNTYPPHQSSLRLPPQTVPEDSILDPAFAADLDRDLADPETFWSGTPMPPPPASLKPGYLKTPSKRSVVRAKRPELPTSPDKRVLSPVRRALGAMSAPPAQRGVAASGVGGVTNFQRRLREGGFGAGSESGFSKSVAGPSSLVGRGRGRGKVRVEFGDVSEMG
jgi:protein SFI1